MEKNGEQVIIYGPKVPRSIYYLAKQVMDLGIYGEETEAYGFLQQIISDADALAADETGNNENSGNNEKDGNNENSVSNESNENQEN